MLSAFEATVEQEVKRLETLHPTPDDIPNCMKLLDEFLSCHSVGSQMKSLYRHGTRADCGRKLEDFKFCMTLKAMNPENKREAWIRRRAEWWATRRLSKSSEDVWDMRTAPLENFPLSHEQQERVLRENGGRPLEVT